jgi:tetratricopeptide (TPR) repeat protein
LGGELLGASTREVLSRLAFFDSEIPSPILTNDYSIPFSSLIASEADEFRKGLTKLKKFRLIQITSEEMPSHESNAEEVEFCSLHPFLRKVVRRIVPDLEAENESLLERIADNLNDKLFQAWDRKRIHLMLGYARAKTQIETHLVESLKKTDRHKEQSFALKALGLALSEWKTNNRGVGNEKEAQEFRKLSEESYRRAIELNPNEADAHNNLGNLLSKDAQRQQEAEQAYRRAIELNPNEADAHYNLGTLLSKDAQRQQEAEQAYRRAIELNPNLAEA